MKIRRTLSIEKWLTIALGFAVCLTLPACSVNVKKDSSGEEKKVDIETPIGGIHVDKGADVHDTGLAVYPGARVKPKPSGTDDNQANVDISFFGYGVRVVAIEYLSDDPPAKIIPFYQDQLKKYGAVLECRTNNSNVNVDPRSDSKALTCESQSGKTVELKVGTRDNQHIVSVSPEGKGSSFALVYVRTNSGRTI